MNSASAVIIRLQLLPSQAVSSDVRAFFHGLKIPDGGVHIVGGPDGDVFIGFASDEDARQAMRRDRGLIKGQEVRLFLSSRTEQQEVVAKARAFYAAATSSDRQEMPPKRDEITIQQEPSMPWKSSGGPSSYAQEQDYHNRGPPGGPGGYHRDGPGGPPPRDDYQQMSGRPDHYGGPSGGGGYQGNYAAPRGGPPPRDYPPRDFRDTRDHVEPSYSPQPPSIQQQDSRYPYPPYQDRERDSYDRPPEQDYRSDRPPYQDRPPFNDRPFPPRGRGDRFRGRGGGGDFHDRRVNSYRNGPPPPRHIQGREDFNERDERGGPPRGFRRSPPPRNESWRNDGPPRNPTEEKPWIRDNVPPTHNGPSGSTIERKTLMANPGTRIERPPMVETKPQFNKQEPSKSDTENKEPLNTSPNKNGSQATHQYVELSRLPTDMLRPSVLEQFIKPTTPLGLTSVKVVYNRQGVLMHTLVRLDNENDYKELIRRDGEQGIRIRSSTKAEFDESVDGPIAPLSLNQDKRRGGFRRSRSPPRKRRFRRSRSPNFRRKRSTSPRKGRQEPNRWCLMLSNMPFRISEEEIVEWMSERVKPTRVVRTYYANGNASDRWIAEFESETLLDRARGIHTPFRGRSVKMGYIDNDEADELMKIEDRYGDTKRSENELKRLAEIQMEQLKNGVGITPPVAGASMLPPGASAPIETQAPNHAPVHGQPDGVATVGPHLSASIAPAVPLRGPPFGPPGNGFRGRGGPQFGGAPLRGMFSAGSFPPRGAMFRGRGGRGRGFPGAPPIAYVPPIGMMRGRGANFNNMPHHQTSGRFFNTPHYTRNPSDGQPDDAPAEEPSFDEVKEPTADDDIVATLGERGCVVTCNGFPPDLTMQDVMGFFEGYPVDENSIRMRMGEGGVGTGECMLAIKDPENAKKAVEVLNGKSLRGHTAKLGLA